MKIIQGTREFHTGEETAVALGKFDGVHRGHRKILKELLESRECGLTPAVFTFEPSAAVFFGGEGVREI
ncbi:MAG: bifunctional riboflavin kinase/FMN adenylyltransferase, partial [Lachnospiraceae bacterium]|nr:bifunctional riboflavin kinase/FMN adenylyltransferase [Lachnospiraceae bacterium]